MNNAVHPNAGWWGRRCAKLFDRLYSALMRFPLQETWVYSLWSEGRHPSRPPVRLGPLISPLPSAVGALGTLHHPRLGQPLVGQDCHNLQTQTAACGYREQRPLSKKNTWAINDMLSKGFCFKMKKKKQPSGNCFLTHWVAPLSPRRQSAIDRGN